MSEVIAIPQYLYAKSGEVITTNFREWINKTQQKLKKSFPPAERAFCRTLDKLKSRLSNRNKLRLHYTRQHPFIVADSVVFFGDFYFRNASRLLIEIDGTSHEGKTARERDEWRTKLISSWNVVTARITNDRIFNDDFRNIESWFIDQVITACPYARKSLISNYNGMKRKYKHIYENEGSLTTYRKNKPT